MNARLRPWILVNPRIRRTLLGLLVVFLLFMALLPRQAQKLLQGIGQPIASIMAIPMKAIASVDQNARNIWHRYIALQGVHEQNEILQEQVAQLQGELNQLREKALQADRLAALLDFQATGQVETIPARIIGRDTSNWYQAIVVDKGTNDGIAAEMGVLTPAGIVGTVVKVASSTSLILLLTDPNSAVAGLVQRTRDEGIVQGTPQGHVRMKYLPPLSPIQTGDVIVTSGLTGRFPRGLTIGTVKQIREEEAALFQSAILDPVVDFSKLEEVLIIRTTQPREAQLLLQGPLSPTPSTATQPTTEVP